MTTELSKEQLESLLATAEKATPGPWLGLEGEGFITSASDCICQFWNKREEDFSNKECNVAHVAAFDPSTCISLVKELIELREENERLRDQQAM